MTSREGSRGGNVRDLDTARALHEQQKEKARWTLIIREHIARTLVETGYFHCDDLAVLAVPEQHSMVIGGQVSAVAARGYMKAIGRRKCEHRAANGRKASIYRITDLGRQILGGGQSAEVGGGSATGSTAIGSAAPAHSPHLGARHAQDCAGAPTSQEAGRATSPPVPSTSADDSPATESHVPVAGEPARLFDPPPERPLNPLVDSEAA